MAPGLVGIQLSFHIYPLSINQSSTGIFVNKQVLNNGKEPALQSANK